MSEPLKYWNPKELPEPSPAMKERPQTAIPVEFDALLTQTSDHAAAQAIGAALRLAKIEFFQTDDGHAAARKIELHVCSRDQAKASVLAGEIFVRRMKLKSSAVRKSPETGIGMGESDPSWGIDIISLF